MQAHYGAARVPYREKQVRCAHKKMQEPLFTEREKEIIRLICRQHTAQEIGDLLFISKRTVEGYRTRILEKMEVKNTAGVVIFALKHHLISESEYTSVNFAGGGRRPSRPTVQTKASEPKTFI